MSRSDLERKLENLENITIPRIENEMKQTQQWWDGKERDDIMWGHEQELKEVNEQIEDIKKQLRDLS